MNRQDILRSLSAERREMEKLGVKSLALFGSAARDEVGPDSDVDLLVEFAGPSTFDAYMDLKEFLENLPIVRDMYPGRTFRGHVVPMPEIRGNRLSCQ